MDLHDLPDFLRLGGRTLAKSIMTLVLELSKSPHRRDTYPTDAVYSAMSDLWDWKILETVVLENKPDRLHGSPGYRKFYLRNQVGYSAADASHIFSKVQHMAESQKDERIATKLTQLQCCTDE